VTPGEGEQQSGGCGDPSTRHWGSKTPGSIGCRDQPLSRPREGLRQPLRNRLPGPRRLPDVPPVDGDLEGTRVQQHSALETGVTKARLGRVGVRPGAEQVAGLVAELADPGVLLPQCLVLGSPHPPLCCSPSPGVTRAFLRHSPSPGSDDLI